MPAALKAFIFLSEIIYFNTSPREEICKNIQLLFGALIFFNGSSMVGAQGSAYGALSTDFHAPTAPTAY